MKKVLIAIGLIFFCVLVSAETITYGETWEKTDLGNGKYLYVGGVNNLKDLNGEWKPLTEVVKVRYIDYRLRFSYNQYWVEYEPYVIRNGNKYTLEWIVNNYSNVGQHIDFNNNRDYWKWSLTINNVPENLWNGVEYLGFDYVDSAGLSWGDITIKDKKIIIKNTIALSFADLLRHNYSIDFNKETVMIGNLDGNYSNGLPHFQDGSITIDPTIIADINRGDDDALNSGIGFGTFDNDNEFYHITPSTTPYRTGWIFQGTNIPNSATITDANIEMSTIATCSTGYCDANVWGITDMDINTWIEDSFEPKDATWTTATDGFHVTVNDAVAECGYKKRSFEVKSIVQEIVDLGDWNYGDNMGFINEGKASGARPTPSMLTFTYEDSCSRPVWKLSIVYTDVTPPDVNLVAPADESTDTEGDVTFDCNASDYYGQDINSVALWGDWGNGWEEKYRIDNNNLALSKDTNASSIYSADYNHPKAVDGSQATKWASESGSPPEWIWVDLNQTVLIDRVIIYWWTADYIGVDFNIQISTDKETWINVRDFNGNTETVNDIWFTPVNARYIRMYGITQTAFNIFSIQEMEVYQSFKPISFDINNIANGDYNWNCRAIDDANNVGWADANWTITIQTDTCTPPASGDWVVNDECYYSSNVVAPANIYIGSTGVIGLTNAILYFKGFISCAFSATPRWCMKLSGTSMVRGAKT